MRNILLSKIVIMIMFIISASCNKDTLNEPKVDDQVPIVTTDSSNSISAHSSVVYGTINTFGIPGSYYFDYGTTTSYGNESIHKNLDSGLTILTLKDTLFNLVPATFYHYRLVCSYNYGISIGEELSFTTVKDDYFPNTSGSQWIYSFFDVVNVRFDTVEVFITNPGTWEYTAYSGLPGYPSYTEGVVVFPNMVQMNSSSSGSRIYLIPFVAGNTWHGPPPEYTFVNYSVTEQDSITTPAGKFYGAFKIRMAAFNGGNTTYIDDRVFVPKVGFVKRNETVTGAGIGTISSYSWDLMSVNIIP